MARIFAYGHEAFHHIVESFACRLEITHREALYREGFDQLYKKYFCIRESIEEALATAHGYRKVRNHSFLKGPGRKNKRAAALKALAAYIELCPPGYNRALEFVDQESFKEQRLAFAEENHKVSLPGLPAVLPDTWQAFPHAFSGISRVDGRVNYIVHRDSPLAQRVQARGHYLKYREVADRLEKHGGCKFVRPGNGSHEIWENDNGERFPVPRHPGDLKPGTLRKIITQAGLDVSICGFSSLPI